MASLFLRSVLRTSAVRPAFRSLFTPSSRLMGGHGAEVSIAKPSVDGVARTQDKIIKVTFVDPDNNRYVVDGVCGESLFQTAMRAQVQFKETCGGMPPSSIFGENGLACYNCHVHVANEFVSVVNQLNNISDNEITQLKECDEDRSDVTQNSRLSCQITLTPELDGLMVLIPTYPEDEVI